MAVSVAFCVRCLTIDCKVLSHLTNGRPPNDNGTVQYPLSAIHVWIDGVYHGCLSEARVLNKIERRLPDLAAEQRTEIIEKIYYERAHDSEDDGARAMVRVWADGCVQYGTCTVYV